MWRAMSPGRISKRTMKSLSKWWCKSHPSKVSDPKHRLPPQNYYSISPHKAHTISSLVIIPVTIVMAWVSTRWLDTGKAHSLSSSPARMSRVIKSGCEVIKSTGNRLEYPKSTVKYHVLKLMLCKTCICRLKKLIRESGAVVKLRAILNWRGKLSQKANQLSSCQCQASKSLKISNNGKCNVSKQPSTKT